MLNNCVIIGRLVRDPEQRYTPSGVAVCNFTLAVERQFTSTDGKRETDFIDIVVWKKLAETCANNLSKGRLVAIQGRLQIRSYDDNNGIRRKVAEIVAENVRFLDYPKDNARPTVENEIRQAQAGMFPEEDFGEGDPDGPVPF